MNMGVVLINCLWEAFPCLFGMFLIKSKRNKVPGLITGEEYLPGYHNFCLKFLNYVTLNA